MESDRAAGLSQPRSDAQKGRWISLVNQDIATDHKVKSRIVHECIGLCFVKSEMPESSVASALTSYRHGLRIQINPNYPTRGTDELRSQHGNITCATT